MGATIKFLSRQPGSEEVAQRDSCFYLKFGN